MCAQTDIDLFAYAQSGSFFLLMLPNADRPKAATILWKSLVLFSNYNLIVSLSVYTKIQITPFSSERKQQRMEKNENPNWYWNQLLIRNACHFFNGKSNHDFLPSCDGTSKAKCVNAHNWNRDVCVCKREQDTLGLGVTTKMWSKAKQSTQKLQFDLCWSLAHWESPANKWLGSVFLICLFYTWKIETKWYFGVQKEK